MNHLLHIYAQEFNHADAWIVGERGALEALRASIDAALANGSAASPHYCADGEGYTAIVVCAEPEKVRAMRLPYQELLNEDCGEALTAFELLDRERYRSLVRGARP